MFFLIIFLLFCIICPIIIILNQKEFKVFPNALFIVNSYCDGIVNGNSSIDNINITENQFQITYVLRNKSKYPFMNSVFLKRNLFYFDIKSFDYLKIKIKSVKSPKIRLYIRVFYKSFKKLTNMNQFIPLFCEIPLWQNKNEYIMPLNKFYVAHWWKEQNNLSDTDKNLKVDLSKTFAFEINNQNNLFINTQDTLTINEITLYQSKTKVIIFFVCTFLIYLLSFLFFNFIKMYNKKIKNNINKIIIPYKTRELGNYFDVDSRKLLDFITFNYKNPELSIKSIGYTTGINTTKIPIIIKKIYKLSFPQYLNALRLIEAKKLLIDTELSITDIAFEVGYNNLTHFNRIFKHYENQTPAEYRKSNKIPEYHYY